MCLGSTEEEQPSRLFFLKIGGPEIKVHLYDLHRLFISQIESSLHFSVMGNLKLTSSHL